MEEEFSTEMFPAEPGDFDEIYTLCRSAAKGSVSTEWGDDYPNRAIIENDLKTGGLYKFIHKGKIISIMKFRPWSDYIKGEEDTDIDTWDPDIHNPCALGRFCVSPEYMGHGLGRKFLWASVYKAKDMGYDGVFFHAAKGDYVATHLYDSMGFHRAGEVHCYDMDFVCYEMKCQ